MRMLLLIAVLALAAGIGAGVSRACNHDILCPEGWAWSDKEGTCVEAPLPTT